MSEDIVVVLDALGEDDFYYRPATTKATIDKAAAEITHLRALCDRQSTALSLSGMRHGRILVGLERRNARQRRALAKMYQRRHDKNAEITRLRAALATARREGMEHVRTRILRYQHNQCSGWRELNAFDRALEIIKKEIDAIHINGENKS